MLKDYLLSLKDIEENLNKIYQTKKISSLELEIEQKEQDLNLNNWNNVKIIQEYNQMKADRDLYNSLWNDYEELKTFIELLLEEVRFQLTPI